MDLRTLRYFITVLEAGSLSRAAGSLYIAQPALTAQIKKLEAELGAQLFDRSHAGVTPTPAGVQLYEDARRLLSDADAVRERIQRLPQGPEGSVTVALPFLLASLLMGPVLARLKQSHPRIRVFALDDLSLMVKKAMVDRRADVGLLVDAPQVEGLQCRPLVRESMYFCGQDSDGTVGRLLRQPKKAGSRRGAGAAATFSPRPEIDFGDAIAQPLVLQSRRFAIRRSVEDAAAERGLALNIAHEQDSTRVLRSLYINGAGFTFTPACALHDQPPPRPGWVVARVVRPELHRSYSLATPAGRPVEAAAQVVVDALVQQVREMIGNGTWEAEWLGGG
ncbi:LysR family transcriptional regulator [Variovorax sp. OV329]|uniref:LysR family transcriptional regulator n=1 Tax=Variovorax sp. OV329 TaxID=1882825 RepID=UPI0008EB991B|nr:LysR family transcriptional regulator [Variovorax sp. OV329]SFM58156.1 DNA-binding transcriptional regulator, LysR family [Variovorax sp. OV329]